VFKILSLGKNDPGLKCGAVQDAYYYDTEKEQYGRVWIGRDGTRRDLDLGFVPTSYEHLAEVAGKFDPYLRFKWWDLTPEVERLTWAELEPLTPQFDLRWEPQPVFPLTEALVMMRHGSEGATGVTMMISEQCANCAHFNPDYGLSCKAFPDGIHKWVYRGLWDHRKLIPQQRTKITFKQRKG
jgi:hypothetical protein